MNIVIVDKTSDDRRRRLYNMARGATRAEQVIDLVQAVALNGDWLTDFPTQSPFQMVIHHCGRSNEEYPVFVNDYRVLCKRNNWPSPFFVLFSGGSVKQAKDDFPSDQRICIVSQEELETNLKAFLAIWDGSSEPPCDVLTGMVLEPALLALSALLPFGLLMESRGGLIDAAKEISMSANGMGIPEFEHDLQQLVAKRLQGPLDKVERDALREKHERWVERLGGDLFFTELEGGEAKLEPRKGENIEGLIECNTVSTWNEKLSYLRDEWLKRVAQK